MSFSDVTSAADYRPIGAAALRRLDRLASEKFGVPGIVLMENAGRSTARAVRRLFPRRRSIAVFCGAGNNGGDGLVAARHLANEGLDVRVVLARPPDCFSGDAAVNWRPIPVMRLAWMAVGSRRGPGRSDGVFQSSKKLIKFLGGTRLFLDALLGTGTRSSGATISEPYRSLIDFLNRSAEPVVAVDVPSGLDADTGRPLGSAVRADATVTMAVPKRGLIRPAARPWVGRIFVADIGMPRPLLAPYRKSGKRALTRESRRLQARED